MGGLMKMPSLSQSSSWQPAGWRPDHVHFSLASKLVQTTIDEQDFFWSRSILMVTFTTSIYTFHQPQRAILNAQS